MGALAAFAAGAGAKELRFDEVFAMRQPVSLQYEARFVGRDGSDQKIEAWREGDARLKRRTNDAVETYAERVRGGPEYKMAVLDLQRKLLTRIDRTNLFRIDFTDWFDLAHALKHPRGEYTLVAAATPSQAQRAVAPCAWYDLKQQRRTSHVCWSSRAQLPLTIVNGEGRTVWRVTKLQFGHITPETFRLNAADYIVNNANEDIERD